MGRRKTDQSPVDSMGRLSASILNKVGNIGHKARNYEASNVSQDAIEDIWEDTDVNAIMIQEVKISL